MTLPVESWVDAGAAKARSQLVPKLPVDMQHGADAAVSRVQQGKGAIGTLANDALARVTSSLSLGHEEDAYHTWLRSVATFEQRQSVLIGGAQGALKATAEQEAAWKEVKAMILDVLKIAGPIALQIVLAMA